VGWVQKKQMTPEALSREEARWEGQTGNLKHPNVGGGRKEPSNPRRCILENIRWRGSTANLLTSVYTKVNVDFSGFQG